MVFQGRSLRRQALLGVLGVLAAAAFSATPANAIVVARTATHGRIGFFPSITYASTHRTSCTTSCSLMTLHTGGTVQHGERYYSIYWAPSGWYIPGAYKSGLNGWLNDFASLDYTAGTDFSVAQQYYDLTGSGGTKSFVPYALSNGGYINDTDAYPASGCSDSGTKVCLTEAQMEKEIQAVVVAHKLPQNANTQYLLFTPQGLGSCFDSTSASCAYTSYCAYHGTFTGPSGPIVFANMPWSYGVSGCDVNTAFGTGYANGSAIDPEVGVLSHEMIETMTDVKLNAWFDSSGNEIGDKCAYIYNGTTYGSMTGLANNGLGYWNAAAAGDEYLMQNEFSNRNSNGSSTGCVGKDTDTQPTVTTTINPNPPVHGTSAQFTANVTDAAGVAYVQWSFGDGTSATGNPVNHTYSTAGSKTLTVIVTDNHGNEKRVVQTITVS